MQRNDRIFLFMSIVFIISGPTSTLVRGGGTKFDLEVGEKIFKKEVFSELKVKK